MSTSATAAVGDWSSGSIECAAFPAISARARGPSKRRASACAERRPRRPKRDSASGWRGGPQRPEDRAAAASPRRAPAGRTSLRYACAVRAAESRARSPRSSGRSATAVPSSSGCASGSAGLDQLEPVLGQRQLAQERRRQRGRVDGRADVVDEAGQRQLRRAAAAADRLRAPRAPRTERPARARAIAAARPFGPAPTTSVRAQANGVALNSASAHPGRRACRASSGSPSCATRCATSTTGAACRRRPPACRPRRRLAEVRRRARVSVCCQKRSSCLWPPMVRPSSKIGSRGAHQHLRLGDRLAVDLGRAERDPAGEHVALRGHQGERLLVGVEHHHAGRELHLARQRHVEQRDLARLDAGQRARRSCCPRARTRGSAASRSRSGRSPRRARCGSRTW